LGYDPPVVFDQVGVVVTLLTCIREKVHGSNLGGDIGYTDGSFSGVFSVQADADVLRRLCHDRFFPNRFQFFLRHHTIQRYIV
jgi:hypothetical protein